jgi:dihydrofolate reductase
VKISVVAAIGDNNEIGLDNKLLWRSKSDLEHFKKLTLGKPIIMGRKTFESLPGILPDRDHYVMTTDEVLLEGKASFGAVWCHNLLNALANCARAGYEDSEVFIIGGASIYEQAMEIADELHISHMNWTGEADTYFPVIDHTKWNVRTQLKQEALPNDPLTWTYKKYVRRTNKTKGKQCHT